jgi:hypothetical protein
MKDLEKIMLGSGDSKGTSKGKLISGKTSATTLIKGRKTGSFCMFSSDIYITYISTINLFILLH